MGERVVDVTTILLVQKVGVKKNKKIEGNGCRGGSHHQ